MFKACAAIRHGIDTFDIMNKIHLPLFLVLAVSCTHRPEEKIVESLKKTSEPAPVVPAGPDSLSGCYQMIIGKDTALMDLHLQNDSLSGELRYKRFEKDSNEGRLRLQHDKMQWQGWYDFRSEGKATVRQIIFKYEEGVLEEAYGAVVMKGDSVFYKYPSTLNFERSHPFQKTACKEAR